MSSILDISLESIDHQLNSKLGELIEKTISSFRKYNRITNTIITNSDITKNVFESSGILINISTEDSYAAYVYPPDINKNSPICDKMMQLYSSNKDAEGFMHDKHFIDGTVDLKRSKVSGDFSKIPCNMCIGSHLLSKGSSFTIKEATAIILHELGHIFVYFVLLSRYTKTQYVLEEGTKRLLMANTKEQRIIILEDIEKSTSVRITKKEELAIKKQSDQAYRVVILKNCIEESRQQLGVDIYDSRAYEQLSDQFSARHGYYRYLALALDKILKMHGGDKAYRNPYLNMFLQSIYGLSVIVGITLVPVLGVYGLLCMLIIGNPLSKTYDPPKVRILKLRQQINDALKDNNIPKELKELYIDDHRILTDLLDKMYYNIDWYTAIYSYLTPMGYADHRDISHLLELESLNTNNLFTSAQELSMLVTSK